MRLLLRLVFGCTVLSPGVSATPGQAAPPNVVVILADDLGWGDMRANNPDRCRIPTPYMDRLAAGGMRFTDAHSSSACCTPSRYTLLTGRYHWRTTLQSGIARVWGAPLIAPDRVTIASLAASRGYATACIGKWHLGWKWPITPAQKSLFTGLGGWQGGGDVSTEITQAHRDAWQAVFSQPIAEGPTTRGFDQYFGTDVPNWPLYCFIDDDRTVGVPSELLSPELVRRNQADLQGPAVPGWKLEPTLPAIADRATAFIRTQAKEARPFLLYLPLTSPHTPLAVNAEWKGKSGLANDYADFVMETDAVLGRVLDALDAAGVTDNTLVVFTSDNGFAYYVGVQELERQGHFPSGPFRGYKLSAYEGGHRVPFVVRWPGVARAGAVCGQLVQQADLMATLAAILDVPLPANAGEDSFSLLPLLGGSEQPIRTSAVNTAYSGLPSYREGAWKYVAAATPELYQLDDDPAESVNLAEKHPERLEDMQAAFEKIIRDGRSTPGAPRENDVQVTRYPQKDVAK